VFQLRIPSGVSISKKNAWDDLVNTTANVPQSRYHHSAVVSPNNKMVIFGGSIDKSKHLNDLMEYSFETSQWQLRSSTGTPSVRAGHISLFDGSVLYIYGGYSGDGGFERLTDFHCLKSGALVWEEVEISGSFPMTARPVPSVFDPKEGRLFVYGGYDGSKPIGTLLELDIKKKTSFIANLWMELDETNIASSAVGSKGTVPLPRYGNCIAFSKGIVHVCLGSGSTYLDDVVQFDTNPEDEDDDDEDEEN